jgi:hypothetical protein
MKHLTNLRLSNWSIGIIVLALLLSLAVSPALAKPKCGGPNPPPGCSDPGGGEGTMTLPPVWAWWTGAVSDGPQDARVCTGSGNAGNGGVSYECQHREDDPDVIVSREWKPDGADKEGLCDSLSSYGLVLDGANNTWSETGTSRITTGYEFLMDPTWNDTACVAGADCLVRVDIWAYFDEWCNDRKCGRLVIVHGWITADPADDGDLNPFTDDQSELVSPLTVTFKGIGANSTVATCLYAGSGTYFNTD